MTWVLILLKKRFVHLKKSWDRGRLKLATADLLTQEPNCAQRSFAANVREGSKLAKGESVTVEVEDRTFIVRKGLTEVARSDSPPPKLLDAVQQSCGIAKGTVEIVHGDAEVAEISLC